MTPTGSTLENSSAAEPATSTAAASIAAGSADGGPGYRDHKQAHLKRLRRVEGQIRGLQRMVDSDQYCIDVLTQVSAATKALQAFSLELLDEHLDHCVKHALESGGETADLKIKEASAAIARLVRS